MTTSHVNAVALLYRLELHLAALAIRQNRLAEAVEVLWHSEGFHIDDWGHLAETLRIDAAEVAALVRSVGEIRAVLRRAIR